MFFSSSAPIIKQCSSDVTHTHTLPSCYRQHCEFVGGRDAAGLLWVAMHVAEYAEHSND